MAARLHGKTLEECRMEDAGPRALGLITLSERRRIFVTKKNKVELFEALCVYECRHRQKSFWPRRRPARSGLRRAVPRKRVVWEPYVTVRKFAKHSPPTRISRTSYRLINLRPAG